MLRSLAKKDARADKYDVNLLTYLTQDEESDFELLLDKYPLDFVQVALARTITVDWSQ